MPIRERLRFNDIDGARVGRLNMGISTTFILYRIGSTLIDSGPSNQWSACRDFFDESPPERLLLTHHHEDHSGNAADVAKRYQLKPLAPELSRAKLKRGFRIPPIQRLAWGHAQPVATEPLPEAIPMPEGGRLLPVHAPGHAKDMVCLWWPERGYLFTGDLYLSKKLTHFRGDENLARLMESIAEVLKLDFQTVICSHRGVVEDGKSALALKLDYLKNLCGEARELRRQGVGERAAVKRLLGPENLLSRLSFYNISKRNLYRQALLVEGATPA